MFEEGKVVAVGCLLRRSAGCGARSVFSDAHVSFDKNVHTGGLQTSCRLFKLTWVSFRL